MVQPQLALWLLARAEDFGAREPLVGDLLEEIARGRSRCWVWLQVVGLCGFAFAAHARKRARVTPLLVALSLTVVLVGGMSISSFHQMFETWLIFYYVAGTASLIAHVVSRAANSHIVLIAGFDRTNLGESASKR